MVPVPPDFSPKGSSSRAHLSTACSPWHPMCTPMGRQHAGGTPQWDVGLVPEALTANKHSDFRSAFLGSAIALSTMLPEARPRTSRVCTSRPVPIPASEPAGHCYPVLFQAHAPGPMADSSVSQSVSQYLGRPNMPGTRAVTTAQLSP